MQVSRKAFLATAASAFAAACGALPPENRICRAGAAQPNPIEQQAFWHNFTTKFFHTLDLGTIIVDPYSGLAPSEAMGHGLTFAAEREDWGAFNNLLDGLDHYYQKDNGLYRWKINPDGTHPASDDNLASATETEQNVAYALLVAYQKTGREVYRDRAQRLLNALWTNAVVSFQGKLIVLPADRTNNPYWPVIADTSGHIQQIAWPASYFSPMLYRAFEQFDINEEHNWTRIIQDGYVLLDQVLDQSSRTPTRFGIAGINPMPDWVWLRPQDENGNVVASYYDPPPAPPARTTSNEWDTVRIPIYIGLAENDAAAQRFLQRFYALVHVVRPEDAVIGDGRWNNALAVASYATGLAALGRDVSAFLPRLNIDNHGFNTEIRDSYYDQAICYLGWLALHGAFPRLDCTR